MSAQNEVRTPPPELSSENGVWAAVGLGEELRAGVDAAFAAEEPSSGDAYVRLKRTPGPIALRALSPRSRESSATAGIICYC